MGCEKCLWYENGECMLAAVKKPACMQNKRFAVIGIVAANLPEILISEHDTRKGAESALMQLKRSRYKALRICLLDRRA